MEIRTVLGLKKIKPAVPVTAPLFKNNIIFLKNQRLQIRAITNLKPPSLNLGLETRPEEKMVLK